MVPIRHPGTGPFALLPSPATRPALGQTSGQRRPKPAARLAVARRQAGGLPGAEAVRLRLGEAGELGGLGDFAGRDHPGGGDGAGPGGHQPDAAAGAEAAGNVDEIVDEVAVAVAEPEEDGVAGFVGVFVEKLGPCLLYTSPSPRDS